MTQILTVPRAFGGTLLITYTPSTSPVPTLQVTAVFRSGQVEATYRSGEQTATYRDGTVTAGGR